MKKTMALLLALAAVFSLVACGGEEKPQEAAYDAPPLQVLEKIWGLYEEDDRFSVMGGHTSTYVDGAPGQYSMENVQDLQFTVLMPVAFIDRVEDAATMVHMYNTNQFSCGALKVSGEVGDFAQAHREGIFSQQWQCGGVERLYMCQVGQVLVVAYGNYDTIETFVSYTQKAWPGAEELYLGEIAV